LGPIYQLNVELDFGKYLWIALAGDISDMIDIDVSTWILASVIGFAYYGISACMPTSDEGTRDINIMIASGWVNFFVSILTQVI
jgi:hypothetical protein